MLKISAWKVGFVLCVFCLITTLVASAQVTFTTIYSFCSQTNCTDGEGPAAGLVQGRDGDLYGTNSGSPTNAGVIFKLTTSGALTTLFSFCGHSCGYQNGADPIGALVLATNGEFYGVTQEDSGTVFKITPGGSFAGLYSFCAETDCTDGKDPGAGLVQATNGNLYGTTEWGGVNCSEAEPPGCGTIFEITPGGAFTTLYSFCAQSGCPEGNYPQAASLIQGTDGDLYGVAPYGGAYGAGTVFKMTLNGTFTTLYSFCSGGGTCVDGAVPGYGYGGTGAGLVQGSDGNFYGTTSVGGTCSFYDGGTIFRITPEGKLATLYSFGCETVGPANPGLIQATDGNFYGTTVGIDNYSPNAGTIFKLTPSGTLTTLYFFCPQPNCTDGWGPRAGLFQATDGTFYGTTASGGSNGLFDGTVFSLALSPPLGPFVEAIPTSGKAGMKVTILGNNLTGSTSVTFNGLAASFTAHSTYITATVPSSATTGYVQVTTASGTVLTSNVKFRVP